MAFPDPIQLKDSAAAVSDFSRRLPIPNGNQYVSTASSAAYSPKVELRSFIVTPKKGDKYMRNVVTISITRVDADDLPHTGSLSMSYVRPLATDITDADMTNLYAYMADFLVTAAGGYKTRFSRGEV
jgi:hypothetical protein